VAWQWLGKLESIASFNRVGDREFFFTSQIVVKPPDTVQVTVNGLGLKVLVQEQINIAQKLFVGDLLYGYIQPDGEVLKGV
jgi:hypothetical protein